MNADEELQLHEVADYLERARELDDVGLPPDEMNASEQRPLPPLVPEPDKGDPWVADAVRAVEAAVTKLVDEFKVHPFAHRVEHSWHVRLIQLLSEWEQLRGWHPLGQGGFKSQVIHKEWPETYAEKLKKRGSFDIAIVTPDQLRQATIDQFRLGLIAAPIVIEMGLGYWDEHLSADHKKLTDSKVQHGYLVHLSRMRSARRERTEKLVNRIERAGVVRVVYVHHDIPNGQVRHKGLDGKWQPALDI